MVMTVLIVSLLVKIQDRGNMNSNLIRQKEIATELLLQYTNRSISDIMKMIPNCILSKQTVHRMRFKLFNKESSNEE